MLEISEDSQIASLPDCFGMTSVEPGRGGLSGMPVGVSIDLLNHLDAVVDSSLVELSTARGAKWT
jgi:hypothetical protein